MYRRGAALPLLSGRKTWKNQPLPPLRRKQLPAFAYFLYIVLIILPSQNSVKDGRVEKNANLLCFLSKIFTIFAITFVLAGQKAFFFLLFCLFSVLFALIS